MRGIDMLDLWRQRRWRKLLNLIDRLPRDTQFYEELFDDEEAAEQMLQHDTGDTKPSRRVSEYSPVVEVMSAVADRLDGVVAAILATSGSTPPKFQPYPRPTTALERVRSRHQLQKHRALVARVLPQP